MWAVQVEMDRLYTAEREKNISTSALEWNPQGSRRVGRPKMT